MRTAKGTFVPNLEPVEFFKKQDGCARMTIDKAFEGDLEGRSYGELKMDRLVSCITVEWKIVMTL